MTSLPIRVLVGGRSTEHDASLHSYLHVLEDIELNTNRSIHCVAVYYISRQGQAYAYRSTPWPSSEGELCAGEGLSIGALIDELVEDKGFVFNLLHGNEGEDGAWQGIAEVANIRGSFGSVFAAALTMNKWAQSLLAVSAFESRLHYPEMWRISSTSSPQDIDQIIHNLNGRTCVVKPNRMGASLCAERYEYLTVEKLQALAAKIAPFDSEILVQEYIRGTEYTCGCIELNGRVNALPIIQAITDQQFLGHAEKHQKGLVQAHLILEDTPITMELKEISCKLFREFDLSAMCRFDYIVTDQGIPYFLEANSIPGLMRGSAFPKMLSAIGLDCVDLVRLCVEAEKGRLPRAKLLPYAIRD